MDNYNKRITWPMVWQGSAVAFVALGVAWVTATHFGLNSRNAGLAGGGVGIVASLFMPAFRTSPR